MQTVTVTALQPFSHEGQNVQPGDVLEVRAVDAAALKYQGRAKLGGYRTAAIEPQSSGFELPTSNFPQSEVAEPAEESEAIATPRRRRYRRRDLTAEE